jgi:hypothetical protein
LGYHRGRHISSLTSVNVKEEQDSRSIYRFSTLAASRHHGILMQVSLQA